MKNRRQKPVKLEGRGRLALPDGDLAYVPGFFSARVGDRLLSDLCGALDTAKDQPFWYACLFTATCCLVR